MHTIQDEIAAFQGMLPRLEREHLGRWVVIHDGLFVDAFDSFAAAADDAVARFGRGPYLIRQVGAPPMTLPVSVMYHRQDGQY